MPHPLTRGHPCRPRGRPPTPALALPAPASASLLHPPLPAFVCPSARWLLGPPACESLSLPLRFPSVPFPGSCYSTGWVATGHREGTRVSLGQSGWRRTWRVCVSDRGGGGLPAPRSRGAPGVVGQWEGLPGWLCGSSCTCPSHGCYLVSTGQDPLLLLQALQTLWSTWERQQVSGRGCHGGRVTAGRTDCWAETGLTGGLPVREAAQPPTATGSCGSGCPRLHPGWPVWGRGRSSSRPQGGKGPTWPQQPL